jgi:hypothetical protein
VAKIRVRVTMFADRIEVDEDELINLRNQGLLVEDEPEPDPQPDPVPAATKQPVKKPAKPASVPTEEP